MYNESTYINPEGTGFIDPRNAELERVKALVGYDALNYAKFCSLLGIQPEDEDLFRIGTIDLAIEDAEESRLESLAEEMPAIPRILQLKPRNQMTRHEMYIVDASPILKEDPFANREEKLRLAMMDAPGQSKKQKIENYSTPALTAYLKGLLKSAEKKAELAKP